MIPFVAGYAVVFGLLLAVALATRGTSPSVFWYEAPTPGELVASLFVLPVATAWIALDALHRVRPRRWLDVRVRRRARLLTAGAGSSLLAIVCTTVGLVWAEEYAPAWSIMPGCAALATCATFLLMPRVRAGRCIQCGYDVRDGGAAGRCPECGTLDP